MRLLPCRCGCKGNSGIFLCCLANPRQPLGHACLALCRVRAGLMSVLLDQRPSLPTLRRRFPAFVRMVHRYCSAVRLLEDVHAGRTALAFTRRPVTINRFRHLRGLPVLVHGISRCAWGLRLRRANQQLALTLLVMLPSACTDSVGALIADFRSSIPSPSLPLFTLRRTFRNARCKTRGRADRYSFLVRLFHPLFHAGLARRTHTFKFIPPEATDNRRFRFPTRQPRRGRSPSSSK